MPDRPDPAPDPAPDSAPEEGPAAVHRLRGAATAPGPLPGTDPREALRTVFGELGEAPHAPSLPQLPARGPGADATGRTAALLVELPVDLQPAGWRFVDRPGRDVERARSFLRADLDELAEAAQDWRGPLVVRVLGPWSLLAAVELPRGERSVSDAGARRDVAASLAEGVAAHVADVRRLVPGADVLVQLDEPSLPAVLAGRLPTQSGYGTLRAVEEPEVRAVLSALVDAVRAAGAGAVLRLPAQATPWPLARSCGADALAVDVSGLGDAGWESVAATVESGVRLWAELLAARAAPPPVPEAVDALRVPWRRVGLPAADLADVVVAPAGGPAGLPPAAVRPLLGRLRAVAAAVLESSGD
ncbi:methionine synthase [Kineococcus terrestris]|uniref:methionine synthase n=1 Tax=Kineococcus terrestris TaxID=2044856 RepID=UPI0034DB673A